jgi:hypothetical protein
VDRVCITGVSKLIPGVGFGPYFSEMLPLTTTKIGIFTTITISKGEKI